MVKNKKKEGKRIRMLKKRKRWEYAMYKGETYICSGTREEICDKSNIKRETFEYYRSNAYKKRLENRNCKNARIIIRID